MTDHDPLCPWLEALKLPERFPDLGGRVGIPDADQCDYEPLIAKVRADERTLPGIAAAMASQWGRRSAVQLALRADNA